MIGPKLRTGPFYTAPNSFIDYRGNLRQKRSITADATSAWKYGKRATNWIWKNRKAVATTALIAAQINEGNYLSAGLTAGWGYTKYSRKPRKYRKFKSRWHQYDPHTRSFGRHWYRRHKKRVPYWIWKRRQRRRFNTKYY